MATTKICSKCKKPFPATTEFFHSHLTNNDGLNGSCKSCVSAYSRVHYITKRRRTISRSRKVDLTGKKFGRLTVIGFAGKKGQNRCWLVECSCPDRTRKVVRGFSLANGDTTSCGCVSREVKAASAGPTHARFKHGQSHKTSTYLIWVGMNQRCVNPNIRHWMRYGGAGIVVCNRWNLAKGGSFENFLADMGSRPSPKYSLSRHLDSGNYEPGNVEWATVLEQRAEQKGKKAMLKYREYKSNAAKAA